MPFGAADIANGLVIQADGNIVLAGYTESSALDGDFAVARIEGGGGNASQTGGLWRRGDAAADPAGGQRGAARAARR